MLFPRDLQTAVISPTWILLTGFFLCGYWLKHVWISSCFSVRHPRTKSQDIMRRTPHSYTTNKNCMQINICIYLFNYFFFIHVVCQCVCFCVYKLNNFIMTQNCTRCPAATPLLLKTWNHFFCSYCCLLSVVILYSGIYCTETYINSTYIKGTFFS